VVYQSKRIASIIIIIIIIIKIFNKTIDENGTRRKHNAPGKKPILVYHCNREIILSFCYQLSIVLSLS